MIRYFFSMIFVLIFVIFSFYSANVDVYTDVYQYNNCIGQDAIEEHKNAKWGMDESIFPEKINENMYVDDFKFVYYNPWDAQVLSYLVVNYTDEDYIVESQRLKEYDSTSYIGYYGVTGFSNYELLAMYADEYNGFVYAISDGSNQIIYVELIFCNYFYDLDYEKYIDNKFLPDGFDAKPDNLYQQAHSS